MTISVLISTYSKEKPAYLDAALQSIWDGQTRRPDEIVLIKDGPLTAELDAIVEKWHEKIGASMKILALDQNHGLAYSLNHGYKLTSGELIARMDSDDISTPVRFQLQEKYMRTHPEVDILGGSLEEFNDEGTLHNICTYPLTMEDVREHITAASPLGHPSVMFRRRFFEDGYSYSEDYPICEDIALWFQAVNDGRIINNIPDTLVFFRRNSSTMKRRSFQKAWSEFKVYLQGTRQLKGICTTHYLYAIARLVFRLMPIRFTQLIYNSKVRQRIRE